MHQYNQSGTCPSESSPDTIVPDDCATAANKGYWEKVFDAVELSDCSGITSGMCLDTDDGKLYSWDGDSVAVAGVLDFEPADSAIAKTDEAETITANWVNTANPWADDEVSNTLTLLFGRYDVNTSEPAGVQVFDIVRADCGTWNPAGLTCGGDDDYLALCTGTGPTTWVAIIDQQGRWYVNSLQLPYSTSGENALTEALIKQKSDEDAWSGHGGSTGEVQDEFLISMLRHEKITFDPDVVCDGDVDRLFIMTVGDDAPNGITLTEWKLSFEADPTTEFGASEVHLKYADAFIGVANAAEMDDLATTAGVASADTGFDASTVANSKVIYLQWDTAYTETGHQVIFEMWYFANED
jgi:hypothetical protein